MCASETNFLLYPHHYTGHIGAWCNVTLTVYFRITQVFAMNHYHMNKGNQSLTQCHTGLSGARCKVNHQTALTQLAPKQWTVSLITRNKSCHADAMNQSHEQKQLYHTYPISHQPKWQHQSRPLAFNHITWAIAAKQDLILKFNLCPWDQLF